MVNKDKITISIWSDLLSRVDDKIDKINFKNRSHVIDSLLREWLKLRQDIWAIIIANECNWNDWVYPVDIPKSLIKIDTKTFLEKQLEMLKRANVEKVVIAVWYQKDKIKEFINAKNFWIEIVFETFNEHDESQTIINKASKKIKANKYLVILWDTYFHDLNLTDFIYYHNTSNVDLSIVVKPIDVSEWYWNIKLEWNNIVKFVEKPKIKDDISFIINAWIYLINWTIIPDWTWNKKIENDFFPGYVSNNKAKAYFHNWKWFHMQDNKTLNLFN